MHSLSLQLPSDWSRPFGVCHQVVRRSSRSSKRHSSTGARVSRGDVAMLRRSSNRRASWARTAMNAVTFQWARNAIDQAKGAALGMDVCCTPRHSARDSPTDRSLSF
eukprot:5406350-Prymnesium_polylepis.2